MTDEQLAAIRARCEAATPGKWTTGRQADLMRPFQVFNVAFDRQLFEAAGDHWEQWDDNCVFIASARRDVLDLLAEVESLRAALSSWTWRS